MESRRDIEREISELDATFENSRERAEAFLYLLQILICKLFEGGGDPSLQERIALLIGISALEQNLPSGRYEAIDETYDKVLDFLGSTSDIDALELNGYFDISNVEEQMKLLSMTDDQFLHRLQSLACFLGKV